MRTFLVVCGGIAAVEILLALYRVPIASGPLMLAVAIAGLALWVMFRLMLALLRDRRDERRTMERIVQQQNLAYQSSLHLLVGVTAQQAALVQQTLALGASLVQERDQYYAQLPGASGPRFPLDVVEAEYWQEITTETPRHGDFDSYPASSNRRRLPSPKNRKSQIVNRKSKGGW